MELNNKLFSGNHLLNSDINQITSDISSIQRTISSSYSNMQDSEFSEGGTDLMGYKDSMSFNHLLNNSIFESLNFQDLEKNALSLFNDSLVFNDTLSLDDSERETLSSITHVF